MELLLERPAQLVELSKFVEPVEGGGEARARRVEALDELGDVGEDHGGEARTEDLHTEGEGRRNVRCAC